MPSDWTPSNGQLNTEKSGESSVLYCFFLSEFIYCGCYRPPSPSAIHCEVTADVSPGALDPQHQIGSPEISRFTE